MHKQNCERIAPSMPMRAQFVECSQALIRMLIPCPGISAPNCRSLRLHMPREIFNQILKIRQGQIPF
jgi:hypothetical protein